MSGILMNEVSEGNVAKTNVKKPHLTPVKPDLASKYLEACSKILENQKPAVCYFCQRDGLVYGNDDPDVLAHLVPALEVEQLKAMSDNHSPDFSRVISFPDSHLSGYVYLCFRGHVSSLERYGQSSKTTNQ